MFTGNFAVIVVVLSLVACVLAAVFAGMYVLNREVDESAR
jgi:hypothetical protein